MTRSNPVTRRICWTTTSASSASVLTRWIRISAGRNGWCIADPATERLRIRLELENRRAVVAVNDPVESLPVAP